MLMVTSICKVAINTSLSSNSESYRLEMMIPFTVTVGTSGVPEKECHAGGPLSFPWPDSEVKLSLRQLPLWSGDLHSLVLLC